MADRQGASVSEDTDKGESHCTNGAAWPSRYRSVRQFTEKLCEPLSPEDCVIQSMPDASPTRWHLAHTTWFFETFVLKRSCPGYCTFHPAFEYLFNSYYNSVGTQFPRPRRGLLSRPSFHEVLQYRQTVDERILELLVDRALDDAALSVIELGLHHEQQHQELILTDIKHVLSCNPLFPTYRLHAETALASAQPLAWKSYRGGVHTIGFGGDGFAYDNETPRHSTYVYPFELADRLVTNGEYLAFMEAGGYQRSELWLSLGWTQANSEAWKAPLYWYRQEDGWWQFTLSGLLPVDLAEPVCHVSYFEADAFARWAGASLPSEAQWEIATAEQAVTGNFVERERFHPAPAVENNSQLFGDVWEWTSSPYTAYPGYKPTSGALGEYNGKFMCNQYVLRGGSCATSQSHVRPTYRNFFPPEARWQFTGIRLAK